MENTFKRIVALTFLVSVTVTVGMAQDKNSKEKGKPTDIFLLIGQSNMAGVARIGALDTITLEHVYLFDGQNEWEKLRNTETQGVNRYSTVKMRPKPRENRNLSPGYTFAKKLASYTGREIGIVSNARGGTRVAWWQKGYTGEKDNDLYEGAVERAKAALQGTPGAKIKGIIWHQGEGDNSRAGSAMYLQRLGQLVADLRADLGDPHIPFIAGEVGQWNSRGLWVNPKIRAVKDSILNADYVTSDGLTSMDLAKNDAHFDTYSQRVFGGRYADKAFELIYQGKPKGATLYSEKDFEGRSVLLVSGDYSSTELEGMGISVGDIASVTLDRRYSVQFFTAKNRQVVKKDNRELSIDNIPSISFIRVTKK